jgi:hypothetical protein
MAKRVIPPERRPVILCECGDHAWCPITQGFVTMVSPQDAHLLKDHFWFAVKQKRKMVNHYVRSKSGGGMLHKRILKVGAGLLVDHRNRNSLDNRRPNLREATRSQNGANRRKGLKATSRFLGVSFNKANGKWHAQIQIRHVNRSLGFFVNEADAAQAYRIAARQEHGDFASDAERQPVLREMSGRTLTGL